MRRRIILAGALAGLPAIAIAADKDKEKTLRERLQGDWVRRNSLHTIAIKGDQFALFDAKQPFKANETGTIKFFEGQDYAVVKTTKGWSWWLFSAGDNAVAIEVFSPTGELPENEDGRVYYRKGTFTP